MTSYIDHHDARPSGYASCDIVVTHSWHDHTRRNLAQHYDPARVDAIMNGRDPKTQMDLIRWRTLGGRKDAA